MEHESFVPTPASRVSAALRTPGVVTASLPGWQPDADAGGEPRGRLRLRVGGSTITYRGTFRVAGRGPTFTLDGEGTEVRGTGTVKVTAEVGVADTTSPEPGATLTWRGSAEAGGRLAAYEHEVVDAAVRRLLDRFSAQLAENAPEAGDAEAAGDTAVAEAAGDTGAAGDSPAGGDAGAGSHREPGTEGSGTEGSGAEGSGAEEPGDSAAEGAAEAGPASAGAAGVPLSSDASVPEDETASEAAAGAEPEPAVEAEEAPAAGGEPVPAEEPPADTPAEPAEPAEPAGEESAGDTAEESDVVDDLGEPTGELDDFELVEVEVEVPESAAALDDLAPPAEAAHARRTMIGRSAEEVDHAPPRGRYAPVPAPDAASAAATLRWAAPAAAALLASAVVVGRVLRRRK